MIKKCVRRQFSRVRTLHINGEGMKMTELFQEREDVSHFLENVSFEEEVGGVLKVFNQLEKAVEKITLSDADGTILLQEQVRRIRQHIEEDDFDASRKALQVARQVHKKLETNHNVGLSTLRQIIIGCCLCQETDLTETYLQQASDYKLDIDCLNHLLCLPKYSSMGAAFLELISSNDAVPNEETYDTLLERARDNGDMRSGKEIYQKIMSTGNRTAKQYEFMMQLVLIKCCQHSQFNEMKEAISLMRSSYMEIRPSEELPAVLSLIIQQCKADETSIPECVKLATQLWVDMICGSVFPPLAVFHSMLRIYVYGSDPDAAEGVITFLKQNDITVTSVMYERLADAYSSRNGSGDSEKADEIRQLALGEQ